MTVIDISYSVHSTLRALWSQGVEELLDDPSATATDFRQLEEVGQALFDIPDLLLYCTEHARRRGHHPLDLHPHATPFEINRMREKLQ